jgi:hypothetical protein
MRTVLWVWAVAVAGAGWSGCAEVAGTGSGDGQPVQVLAPSGGPAAGLGGDASAGAAATHVSGIVSPGGAMGTAGAPASPDVLPMAGAGIAAGMPGAMAPDVVPVDEASGELCYELRTHGVPSAGDTSKYSIRPGEHYSCFFYRVPWTAPVEGTAFGNVFENQQVLHHWLLYTTAQAQPDGNFVECVGTHIGDTAQLLAGWAVGGKDVVMPKDVGFDLPAPGTTVMVEWHYYNSSGAPVLDGSGIRVCTLPKGTRPNSASITWLGTENLGGPIGMPAGRQSDFSGTCVPRRAGMDATTPIHIFAFLPHMHKLGRNMRSVVNRANGTREEVFNLPFDFNYQIHYDVAVDLYPGDTITSTCTFLNDTNAPVPFGNSSDTEMCYQFAFSYPAGALHNGAFGLNGATNNCW